MESYQENIPLTKEDIKKIRKILKETRFGDFEIHRHFFRDKFVGMIGKEPRHNIDLEELKKIHSKPELVNRGFKRKAKKGYMYTLCYQESKNVFVKVGYLFDEKPMKIFLAIRIYRNLEKAVKRKYGLSL